MAPPQKRIPIPIKMLVTIAGVEWNCVNVYKIIPANERNNCRRENPLYKDEKEQVEGLFYLLRKSVLK
jgi:hypothetical protein